MKNKLISMWIYVAIILPLVFGITLAFFPSSIPNSAELSAFDVARMVGFRDIIFSVILGFAVYKKFTNVIVILLAGRGMIDLSDAVSGIISTGAFSPSHIMPVTAGLISLIVSYILSKSINKE